MFCVRVARHHGCGQSELPPSWKVDLLSEAPEVSGLPTLRVLNQSIERPHTRVLPSYYLALLGKPHSLLHPKSIGYVLAFSEFPCSCAYPLALVIGIFTCEK